MTDQQKHIFIKAVRGEALTAEETTTWQDWLNASEENKKEYQDAQWAWTQSQGLYEAEMTPSVDQAWLRMQREMGATPARNMRRLRMRMFLAAALVVATISAILIFSLPREVEWVLVADAMPDIQAVTLTDGSQITVYPETKLYRQSDFGEGNRNLKLRGKAWFDVTHDPENRMNIDAGHSSAEVVGTAFYLSSHDSVFSGVLQVMEGQVRYYDTKAKDEGKIVAALEFARTFKGGRRRIAFGFPPTKIPPRRPTKLEFDDQPLDAVLDRLEAVYHIPYQRAAEGLSNCRFTGSFENAELEEIHESIRRTLQNRVEFSPGHREIVISGSGCPTSITPSP